MNKDISKLYPAYCDFCKETQYFCYNRILDKFICSWCGEDYKEVLDVGRN